MILTIIRRTLFLICYYSALLMGITAGCAEIYVSTLYADINYEYVYKASVTFLACVFLVALKHYIVKFGMEDKNNGIKEKG